MLCKKDVLKEPRFLQNTSSGCFYNKNNVVKLTGFRIPLFIQRALGSYLDQFTGYLAHPQNPAACNFTKSNTPPWVEESHIKLPLLSN